MHVRIGHRAVRLPDTRPGRIALGAGLVLGGLLSFLPVLGMWMLPLGLVVLSVDSPAIRRLRRHEVGLLRWWRQRPRPAPGA